MLGRNWSAVMDDSEESLDDELSIVAMQVILNAGDARNFMDKAIDALGDADYGAVDARLRDADESILKAHNAQTGMIQRQAAGEKFEYSLIFVHAQDTLMTIDAELHLFKRLLPVLRGLQQRDICPDSRHLA
jgi:PTS system cellobiose-specific IIA component